MSDEQPVERFCETCGTGFLVPVAERQFRRERGLHDPAHCPDCRARMRATRNADLIALYDRIDASPYTESAIARSNGAAERRNGHARGQAPRQSYNTVCASCGAETRVPFVPRRDRPVYCRDCYNARRGR